MVVMVATGCSSGGGSTDGSSGKVDTLRILLSSDTVEKEIGTLVSKYQEKTGTKLEIDTAPYDALQQKAFAEAASGSDHYDIIMVDTPWTPALIGSLEPLGAYIENAGLNKDVAEADLAGFIPKVFFDTAVYQADEPIKQYPEPTSPADIKQIVDSGFDVFGMPLQANGALLTYRKDLFEDPDQQAQYRAKYGRDLAVPTTWAEFKDVSEFFTQPDKGLYGATVQAGVGEWATVDFKMLLTAFGGDGHLISDDLNIAFNSPEGVKALKYYKDLIDSGAVPPGSTSADWSVAGESFKNGISAMTITFNTLELSDQVSAAGGEVGFAVVPEEGTHFGTWMLSVNRNSQHKDAAYQAAVWLTALDQQIAMTDISNNLHATRVKTYEAVAAAGGDPLKSEYYTTLGASLAVGVGRPRLTNYAEVSHEVAVAVNEAVTGAATPEAALQAAADRVQSLLDAAGY